MTRSRALIRLNPDLAVCWEPPHTVRVGFEVPVARAEIASASAQRALAELMEGIPEGGWIACDRPPLGTGGHPTFTMALGAAAPRGARELFLALRPALVLEEREAPGAGDSRLGSPFSSRRQAGSPHGSQPQVRLPIRTVLSDDGRPAVGLREMLQTGQLCNFARSHQAPELVVQVLRFLEPLERTRRWLGRGLPQLVIRFTDSAVRVGPLIDPSGSPCHGCEVLHLVDGDPHLADITAQLIGTHPSSESPSVVLAAGAAAVQFIESWLAGETWVRHAQLELRASQGRVTQLPRVTKLRQHPECGCALEQQLPNAGLRHEA